MDFDDETNKLLERSIYYRGSILYKCIILEKEIEDYIIRYFVTDFSKHIDMRETIIDRIFFDSKISVFEELLKRRLSPEDKFDKVYGKLFRDLRYVKDIRNKFAHFITDLSFYPKTKTPKEFSLINYRNGTDVKKFSESDYDIFNEKIKNCMEQLIKMNP